METETNWTDTIQGVLAPPEGSNCPKCASRWVEMQQFFFISPTAVFDRRKCLSCEHGWERRWNVVARTCRIK
jgi:hypothetical protein